MEKYEFTGETKQIGAVKLHRIRALKDFGFVAAGDLGGWIEGAENLSHDGGCWVSGDAWVSGNARVSGDAQVSGNAQVSGDAWVSGNARVSGDAWVSGNARVFGNAHVSGNARVFGNAHVSGYARVFGNAHVYGNAQVYGNARVSGDARVAGDAEIKAPKDTFWISAIGSRYGTTTFFRCADGKVRVTCGCFYGDLDEFLAKVEDAHGDNKHGRVYKKAVELAKIQMEEDV